MAVGRISFEMIVVVALRPIRLDMAAVGAGQRVGMLEQPRLDQIIDPTTRLQLVAIAGSDEAPPLFRSETRHIGRD